MKQRILVSVVGVPALLAVLCWAPEWATAILLMALSIVGAHELLMTVCGKEKTVRLWGLTACMAVLSVVMTYYWQGILSAKCLPWCLCAFVIAVFGSAVLFYGTEKELLLPDICAMLLGGIAIPMALSCLLRLRLMPYGGGLVLMPLVAAFMSDSMALFAGMAFGKHKLAPRVSPKKTVEGAVGGLLGGVLGMVIFRMIFSLCTAQSMSIGWCLCIGLVGAAMGQLGDLSFSMIKRQYGIKDYGHLLPGHGGILDRFDSVIFAAPVVWLLAATVTLY